MDDFFKRRIASLANKKGDGFRTTYVLYLFLAVGFFVIWTGGDKLALVAVAITGTAIGAFVGFLFGVPRILQQENSSAKNSEQSNSSYRQNVNTNLEQISDWLTKTIVGLGLVHLARMPGYVTQLVDYIAYATSAKDGSARAYILSTIIYFPVVGFFVGYLATRLFLAPAFSRADRAASKEFDRSLNKLEENVAKTELSKEVDKENVAQDSARRSLPLPSDQTWAKHFEEFNQISTSSISNREKLVSVAILLEKMLVDVSIALKLETVNSRNPRRIASELASKGLITLDEMKAFDEFWHIRNQAVHGDIPNVSDSQIARVLDLAWRLVRTFA